MERGRIRPSVTANALVLGLESLSPQTLLSVFGNSKTQLALSIDRSNQQNTGSILSLNLNQIEIPQVVGPSFEDGTWHQVAIAIGADGVTFYIDGQNLDRRSLTSIPPINGELRLGEGDNPNGSLKGQMTGVSVWPLTLSDAQILELMNANPALGGLSAGVSCSGYWLFDPAHACNLMNPESKATTVGSGTSFITIPVPVKESYLYFGSYQPTDIFAVDVSDIQSAFQEAVSTQISESLTSLVQSGARPLTKGSTDVDRADAQQSLDPDVSFLGFITETMSNWQGASAQAFGLARTNNGVPPSRDTTQTAFVNNEVVMLSKESNFVAGMSAPNVYQALATKMQSNGQGWSDVNATDTELTATKTTDGGQVIDLALAIENGHGFNFLAKLDWGLIGDKDTFEIQVGGIINVSVVTTGGDSDIGVSLEDPSSLVKVNWSSNVAEDFELLATILFFLSPLLWLLAVLWYLIVDLGLTIVLNKLAMVTLLKPLNPSDDFTLSQIIFEDGILVEGLLSPTAATVTKLSPEGKGLAGESLEITGEGFFSDTKERLLVTKARVAGVYVGVTPNDLIDPENASFENATIRITIPAGSGVATPVQVLSGGFWSAASRDPAIQFAVVGNVVPVNVQLVTQEAGPGDAIKLTCEQGFTGANKVTFEATRGRVARGSTNLTVESDTAMSVVLPTGVSAQGGPWTVSVWNAATGDKGVAAGSKLKIYSAPTITTAIGPGGKEVAAVGETVTVTGSNLIATAARPLQAYFFRSSSQGAYSDTVNLGSAMPCEIVSSEKISFTAKGGAVGNLVILGAGGYSKPHTFVIETAEAPVIDSFKPPAGPSKSAVVVSGSNFTGTTRVTVGGQNCYFVLSEKTPDSAMTATIPGIPDSGLIEAYNQNGHGQSPKEWYFAPVPGVTSVSKNSAPPGETVEITGSGFEATNGMKLVQGVGLANMKATTCTTVSDSSLSATVPPTGVGYKVPVSVITYGGENVPNESVFFQFVATAPPSISSVKPARGGSGTIVTIEGSGFTGLMKVTLGKDTVEVQLVFGLRADGEVQATIADPKEVLTSGDTYDVTVTNNATGVNSVTYPNAFTYEQKE